MLCHKIWNNGLLLLLVVFCCVEMIQSIPANFLSLHNTPVCLEVEHVQPCQRPWRSLVLPNLPVVYCLLLWLYDTVWCVLFDGDSDVGFRVV